MKEEEISLGLFFESFELFADAAWSGALLGFVLGGLGVYVVLRRLVFLSAALGQLAGLGVAVSFWLERGLGLSPGLFPPTLGAALAAALGVLPATFEPKGPGGQRDALLGLLYLVGAAGTLALGTRIVQDLHDIDSLLLGSAVAVTPENFRLVAVISAVLVALHLWAWRGFAAASFDRASAQIRGLPVRALDLVLLLSLAAAVSVSTRVIGALPSFALSVLPAIAATRLAANVPRALLLAAALGAFAGFAGYAGAFVLRLPVGPAQTLVAALVAIGAYVITASGWPRRSR